MLTLRGLPLFWRFQLGGWLAFTVFSFPLKWVVFETMPSSVVVSLYRDGLGFILTLGMREIYRRVYSRKIRPIFVTVVVCATSIVGGAILTVFSLLFHSALDFEEEKILVSPVIFAIFYFRTGLCACWSILYFGIKRIRDGMDRDLRLAHAEARRREAELQMLRAQMNPHFLYNALNAAIAGVGKPGQHLKELLQALAEYLRYSLTHRNDDLVPLGEEYDAIANYLTVEKARFRDALEIDCQIHACARDALVPGILIQPLVENAIKHGRKTSPAPLQVRLVVTRLSVDRVMIEVSNSGSWIEPETSKGIGGVGLQNLRQRLSLLYPEADTFSIINLNGWVSVRLEIPVSR